MDDLFLCNTLSGWKKRMCESSADIYAFNYDTAFDFLARIHVLDYIHTRVHGPLAARIEGILRKMYVIARNKIKEMYGYKMAGLLGSHTPEDDKQKTVRQFISKRVERGKLLNLVDHLSYDEATGQLMFNEILPLDMKHFRNMDDFTPRDLAVAFLRLKPMDFRRETEMEKHFEDEPYSFSSWRESRLEDVEYAIRKQMENASWEDIGAVFFGHQPNTPEQDRKAEAGLVARYGDILEWSPGHTPLRQQRVFLTRTLQQAHHSEPVMATKIGLSEKDLYDLSNNIQLLPSDDQDENERHYMRLGRRDPDMGERIWLLDLARKHGVDLESDNPE